MSLTLDGYILDELSDTSEILPSLDLGIANASAPQNRAVLLESSFSREGATNYGKQMYKWNQLACSSQQPPYCTGEDHETVFLKTITPDSMPDGLDATLQAFRHWKSDMFTPSVDDKKISGSGPPQLEIFRYPKL